MAIASKETLGYSLQWQISKVNSKTKMKNQIASDQNNTRSLKLQMAKEHMYRLASRFQIAQGFIPAGNAVIWLIVLQQNPELKVWSVFLGFLIPLFDAVLLDPLQKKWKLTAAKVQELFDSELLHLQWNSFKVGEKLDEEIIVEHAEKFKRKKMRDNHLANWYTFEFADLPYSAARIICQRSNCWWDSQMRNVYSWLLLGFISIIGATAIVYGIAVKLSMDNFILTFVAPLAPFVLWAIKEARHQRNTAKQGEKLLKYANQIWAEACKHQEDESSLQFKSRELQDEIFSRRKDSPINPRWLYFFKRNEYQKQMVEGGQELITNYRQKL
jgi:hypothetical protein